MGSSSTKRKSGRPDSANENTRLSAKMQQEAAERERSETALRAITRETFSVTGDDYLRSLLRYLIDAFKVRYAFVTECANTEMTRVRTVAFLEKSKFLDNIEYDLAGTPCEHVIGGSICYYPGGLEEQFPREAGMESYLGLPLHNASGKIIGHLAILDDKPMDLGPGEQSVLKSLAARTGAELERKQAEEALRESEEKFRSGFEHATIGMAMTGGDGRFLSVNKSFCKMLGYSENEMLNTTFQSITFLEDIEESVEKVQQVLRGEIQSFQVEKRYLHKLGHIVWAITTASVVHDLQGKPWYLFAQIQDITERKKAEDALRESEERYRSLFEDSPISLWEEDFSELKKYLDNLRATGIKDFKIYFEQHPEAVVECASLIKITSVNKATLELYKAENKEDLLHSLDRVFVEDSYRTFREELFVFAEGRLRFETEAVNRTLEDNLIWVAIRWSMAPGYEKTWEKVFVSVIDITERKQAREALQKAHDELEQKIAERTAELRAREVAYRDLYEDAPNVYLSNGADGLVKRANRRAAEFFGYTIEEIIGRPILSLVAEGPTGKERAKKVFKRFLAGLETLGEEMEFRKADGSRVWGSVSVRPFRDEKGEIVATRSIIVDINDRKIAEFKLQEAKEAAEAANRAKSEFLANMSHELRTPLNSILGYTQILRKNKKLDASQEKGVEIIERSGEHLLTLINDILDLSKIEAGKIEIQQSEFQLPEFLRNLVDLISIRAEQKKLYFKYEPGDALPAVVLGDEKRLRQVLLNLLSNAVKFTGQGGVTFRVQCDLQNAPLPRFHFRIEDTGKGIPADKLEEIFLPFHQLGDGQEEVEGTGLGLAISKRLTQFMSGVLQVESVLEKGSVFELFLELPIAAEYEEAGGPLESGIDSSLQISGFRGEPKKILIADDKWENRYLLVNMLEPLGFEVIEAKNGKDAIKKTRLTQPDLILMDIVMPVMDGFEATRQIRRLTHLPDIVIIATSASVFELNRLQSANAGCDDFIPKPVRSEMLLEKIEKHLKVEWIYDSSPAAKPEKAGSKAKPASSPRGKAAPTASPPIEKLNRLYELAQMGDIGGLQQQLQEIEVSGKKFHPFTAEVREMLKSYRMKQIREFVKGYMGDD